MYISRKERQHKTEETEGRKLQIHTHNQYESKSQQKVHNQKKKVYIVTNKPM